jgi:hypothetical protein
MIIILQEAVFALIFASTAVGTADFLMRLLELLHWR